jgi:hypothetical protein
MTMMGLRINIHLIFRVRMSAWFACSKHWISHRREKLMNGDTRIRILILTYRSNKMSGRQEEAVTKTNLGCVRWFYIVASRNGKLLKRYAPRKDLRAYLVSRQLSTTADLRAWPLVFLSGQKQTQIVGPFRKSSLK